MVLLVLLVLLVFSKRCCSQWQRLGPIDQTPGIPGSDKTVLKTDPGKVENEWEESWGGEVEGEGGNQASRPLTILGWPGNWHLNIASFHKIKNLGGLFSSMSRIGKDPPTIWIGCINFQSWIHIPFSGPRGPLRVPWFVRSPVRPSTRKI